MKKKAKGYRIFKKRTRNNNKYNGKLLFVLIFPPPKRMLELSEIVSSSSNLWPRASFPLEAIEIFWPQLYTWSSCNPFHPFLVNILDFFSPPFYLSWKFPIAVCSASQFRALPIQQIPRTNCQLKKKRHFIRIIQKVSKARSAACDVGDWKGKALTDWAREENERPATRCAPERWTPGSWKKQTIAYIS